MPVMSQLEQAFCRSAPWRWVSQRVVVPWALQDQVLEGRVLELGSGSGAMAADLLDRYGGVHLVASDIDLAMVTSARNRLRDRGDRADVAAVDATMLPFSSAQFDVVVSFLMLHHVIAWERAVLEAFRVLRPGGQFIGYDLLNSVPARIVHLVDRSPHRLATCAELAVAFEGAEVTDVAVRKTLGGLVVQFAATKGSPVGGAFRDGE